MQNHGSNTDVVANGYVLTPFLNTAGFSASRDSAESTTFRKTSKTHVPGKGDTTMSLAGVWEGELDSVDDVLFAALGAGAGIASFFPTNFDTVGNLVYSLRAAEMAYAINTAVGGVAQNTAELAAGDDGYGIERGLVAKRYQAEGALGNGGVLDNGAVVGATNNGASLIIHATVSNALNAWLQDSADGVTFADLPGSLVSANGRSSLRLEVPGTIRRYTRVRWTGTGTFVAVISRR